jgi:hypothetical protein
VGAREKAKKKKKGAALQGMQGGKTPFDKSPYPLLGRKTEKSFAHSDFISV